MFLHSFERRSGDEDNRLARLSIVIKSDLKAVFLKLKYPERLIDSTISRFNHSLALDQTQSKSTLTNDNPIRIILTFKDQTSADIAKNLQPIFTSRKFIQDLRVSENKPSQVNQQCVVYEFKCRSLASTSFPTH